MESSDSFKGRPSRGRKVLIGIAIASLLLVVAAASGSLDEFAKGFSQGFQAAMNHK